MLSSLLPFLPRRFGLADEPTQSPISIGQLAEQRLAVLLPCGLTAHQFQRADHPGGARQLVQRQQPQCVAHQHRHARAERAAGRQPTIGDRVGGEAKIRLGLAAAGREEQQVHRSLDPGASGSSIRAGSSG